jgi:hypothetical protein
MRTVSVQDDFTFQKKLGVRSLFAYNGMDYISRAIVIEALFEEP